jgi:murein DD-endopeptidase MepM/ murein hydrolase activator NlpD
LKYGIYGHRGVDLGPAPNTEVYASTTGTVVIADSCGDCINSEGTCDTCSELDNLGAGNIVVVEYTYKQIPNRDREAWGLQAGDSAYFSYHHLTTIFAPYSQQVDGGDVLGTTGNTGNTYKDSNGNGGDHLHLEIRVGPPNAFSTSGNSFSAAQDAWSSLRVVDPTKPFSFSSDPPWVETVVDTTGGSGSNFNSPTWERVK